MATATLTKTDYAAHVLEVMRSLPIEKQAQVSGYVDAIQADLIDDPLLKTLDDLYAQAAASGELQDMEQGFKARGL